MNFDNIMINITKIQIIKKQLIGFIQPYYQKYKNKIIYLPNEDALHYLIHSLQMKVNNNNSKFNNINKNRCNIYVMAPLDVINGEGKPSYLNKFTDWCSQLKEGGIDGVMIDVW